MKHKFIKNRNPLKRKKPSNYKIVNVKPHPRKTQ